MGQIWGVHDGVTVSMARWYRVCGTQCIPVLPCLTAVLRFCRIHRVQATYQRCTKSSADLCVVPVSTYARSTLCCTRKCRDRSWPRFRSCFVAASSCRKEKELTAFVSGGENHPISESVVYPTLFLIVCPHQAYAFPTLSALC